MTTASNVVRAEGVSGLRWGFLAICVVCMIMIANLQYGWTLFVNPMNKAHGWSIASIQFAFSIFIALETWLTPIEGWIVDVLGPQRGPKIMIAFGGITVAIGWVINAYAQSLEMRFDSANAADQSRSAHMIESRSRVAESKHFSDSIVKSRHTTSHKYKSSWGP